MQRMYVGIRCTFPPNVVAMDLRLRGDDSVETLASCSKDDPGSSLCFARDDDTGQPLASRPLNGIGVISESSTVSRQRTLMAAVASPVGCLPSPKVAAPHVEQKR